MKDYLINSHKQYMNDRREYYIKDVPLYIINPLPEHIDIGSIVNSVESVMPQFLLNNVEGVYVGNFPELKKRDLDSMFKDGVIYISSYNDDKEITEDVVVRNIVHELAHALEDAIENNIYGDFSIDREYILKKKKLITLLQAQDYKFPHKWFFDEKYVEKLDNFLYDEVGYDKLAILSAGLFISPYSITTFREYFANGFEEYFLGDSEYLRETSPALYNKIKNIIEEIE